MITSKVIPDVINDPITPTGGDLFTVPMDNLIFSALKICAVSAAQLVVFVGCYEAVVDVYQSRYGEMNRVFGFGMQMNLSLYLLSILAGVNSLGHILLNRVPHKLIVTLVCTAVWVSFWGNILEFVPNRFALLSTLGMISFLSAPVLNARRVQSGLA